MQLSDSNIYLYDVFISYSNKDKELVKKLKEKLYHLGLEVFLSDISLENQIGDMFLTEISSALEKSKLFVLIASENSINSIWVQLEYQNFINVCYVDDPENRKLIILKDSKLPVQKLPIILRSFQITESVNVAAKCIFDNKAQNISRNLETEDLTIKDLLTRLDVEIDLEEEGFITAGIGNLFDDELINSITGRSTHSRASRVRRLLSSKLQKLGEHKLAKDVDRTSIIILLLRGENPDGESIYAYVAIKLTKLEEFMDAQNSGDVFYPESFGEIIYSGIGNPPPKVKMDMEKKFGYDHDNEFYL